MLSHQQIMQRFTAGPTDHAPQAAHARGIALAVALEWRTLAVAAGEQVDLDALEAAIEQLARAAETAALAVAGQRS